MASGGSWVGRQRSNGKATRVQEAQPADRTGARALLYRAAQFELEQEYLAIMLGVRRGGVTVAASALQDAGLIRYRRGNIRVLDRGGLEAAACECYGVVREHFDHALG